MQMGWDPIDELEEHEENTPAWACVLFVILLVLGSLACIL